MVQMSNIECILRDSTNILKGYIVFLMKRMNLEVSARQLVHEFNLMFKPVWEAAVTQISSTICLTAYCHYLDWCHYNYSKYKISHETAESLSTGNQTTTSVSSDLTLISSDLSTSSSDLIMISSTELLPNAHPEPLAKKVKTQSAKKPKLKLKLKKTKMNGKGKQKSGL